MTRLSRLLAALALACALAPAARAADPVALSVTIRGHHFEPAELHAPAGVAIVLTVVNADPTPEEFESKPLRIEKVVAGGHQIVLRLRPLTAGRYDFAGEYHEDSAHGVLVIGGAN